ncbi:MAG: hypothetical protein NC037_00275 [Bacteroides sp.]|nr:hypothetical protein [Bacillota bacterium]MCM1393746.1 hypothetical protein [[Eubacterium] siraeum]MCM1454953.1 hypothetical protein [Bacteroides sp.]
MNKFNKHVKSDKIKWAIAFIAILMIAVFCVGLSLQLFGTGKQKPSEWFNSSDNTDNEIEEVADSSFIVTPYNSDDGIALTALAVPMAEDENRAVRRLTAKVNYNGFYGNEPVDWAISFVNPDSEWATGKVVTDYVSLAPTADGALTADIECLQAFGEQIKVTATLRSNDKLYSGCTVDYKQKLNLACARFSMTPSGYFRPISFYVGKNGEHINSNGITKIACASESPLRYEYNAAFIERSTRVYFVGSSVYTIPFDVPTEYKVSMRINPNFLKFAQQSLDLKASSHSIVSDMSDSFGCLYNGKDLFDAENGVWNELVVVNEENVLNIYFPVWGYPLCFYAFWGTMLSEVRIADWENTEQFEEYKKQGVRYTHIKQGFDNLFRALDLFSKSTEIDEADKYNCSIKFEYTADGETVEYVQNFLFDYTYPATGVTVNPDSVVF